VCCPCAIQIRRFGQSYGLFLTTQGLESRTCRRQLRGLTRREHVSFKRDKKNHRSLKGIWSTVGTKLRPNLDELSK